MMHATCCAAHEALCYSSPGAIAFFHDMYLDIPFFADIITIQPQH